MLLLQWGENGGILAVGLCAGGVTPHPGLEGVNREAQDLEGGGVQGREDSSSVLSVDVTPGAAAGSWLL